MLSITKTYTNNKASHRQWRHAGHCSRVHGENWTFSVTFVAHKLDDCGFIIDFGKLQPVAHFMDEWFDHTLLIDADDPAIEFFHKLDNLHLCRLKVVASASAEGLAMFVHHSINNIIKEITDGRVSVAKVVCFEDSKNSATYSTDVIEDFIEQCK